MGAGSRRGAGGEGWGCAPRTIPRAPGDAAAPGGGGSRPPRVRRDEVLGSKQADWELLGAAEGPGGGGALAFAVPLPPFPRNAPGAPGKRAPDMSPLGRSPRRGSAAGGPGGRPVPAAPAAPTSGGVRTVGGDRPSVRPSVRPSIRRPGTMRAPLGCRSSGARWSPRLQNSRGVGGLMAIFN